MEQSKENILTTLLSVSLDADNRYHVSLAKGSNVSETAFAMSVIIKCLLKDKLIDKAEDVIDLVKKYTFDPQYEELKDEGEA